MTVSRTRILTPGVLTSLWSVLVLLTAGGPASGAGLAAQQQATPIQLDEAARYRDTLSSASDTAFFTFTGTAGQEVDLAAISGEFVLEGGGLRDPVLTLLRPDGTTVAAENNDAPAAASLPFRSALLPTVPLPVDGEYTVAVSVGPDNLGNFGEFVLLAREAGPILGFDRDFDLLNLRVPASSSEEDRTRFRIFKFAGPGTLDWSLSEEAPWLQLSPTTGTASLAATSAAAMDPALERWHTATRVGGSEISDREIRTLRGERLPARPGAALTTETRPADRPAANGAGTIVEAVAAPGPRSAGDLRATIEVTTPADWLSPFQSQLALLRIFDAEFDGFSELHFASFDRDSAGRAMGLVFFGPSELRTVGLDGSVSAPLVDLSSAGAGAGHLAAEVRHSDGDVIIGQNVIDAPLLRFDRSTGRVTEFATAGRIPVYLTQAPDGTFFVSDLFQGRFFRISEDGSTVEPFGPTVGPPRGVVYQPIDGFLYAGIQFQPAAIVRILPDGGGLERVVDLATLEEITGGDPVIPDDMAAGASGDLYLYDRTGRVWRISPAGDARILGLGPFPRADFAGIEVLEGTIVIGEGGFGNGGAFLPVDDGPPGPVAVGAPIRAHLQAETRTATDGASSPVADGPEDAFGVVGEPVTLRVQLAADAPPLDAASYRADVTWPAESLTLQDVSTGDFGGGLTTETPEPGRLVANASRPQAPAEGTSTLFRTAFATASTLEAGTVLDVRIDFTELRSEAGDDLLPRIRSRSTTLCVGEHVWGDVDGNGSLGSGDAVVMLRRIVGLSAGPDLTPDVADVDGDGQVGVGDAIQVLRAAVELPTASQRLGELPFHVQCR